jgi:excisionase family DNA binding protein
VGPTSRGPSSRSGEPSSDPSHGRSQRSPGGQSRTSMNRFERCYSIAEVARILGVGRTSVRRLMHSGQLPYLQVSPRRLVIRECDLEKFLARLASGAER